MTRMNYQRKKPVGGSKKNYGQKKNKVQMLSLYPGTCRKCKESFPIGTSIFYFFNTKDAEHTICKKSGSAAQPTAAQNSSKTFTSENQSKKNILSKEEKLEILKKYKNNYSIPLLLKEYKITLDFMHGLVDGSELFEYLYPYLKENPPF